MKKSFITSEPESLLGAFWLTKDAKFIATDKAFFSSEKC